MDSYSGIIIEESRRSEQFSDFTPIPCKGFNILCKAKRYGRWWVLKGLKKPYRQDENYKNLLHKEFDILISLQHPNIVSAYSMEEIPEMGTCIVMEWIDGITLEHWSGSKTEGEAIFLQLLDAVHYIHAKQIVHRDLKPSNIMITHNGNHVKLIDFGLSDTDDFAILKQPAGTPSYISPEQIVSQQADIRNDIFSIGCILEKILPGKPYTAIIKSAGSDSIPSLFLSCSVSSNTFSRSSASGCTLFFMPSIPAARHSARTRYGFAEGSGFLSSTLLPSPLAAGILISGLLFVADQVI